MMNLTKFLLLFSLLSIFISCSKDDAASDVTPPPPTLKSVLKGKWVVVKLKKENGSLIPFNSPIGPVSYNLEGFNFIGQIEFKSDSTCRSAYGYEFEETRTFVLKKKTETYKSRVKVAAITDDFTIVSDDQLKVNIDNFAGMTVYKVSDLTETSFTLKANVDVPFPNRNKFDFTISLKQRGW